MVLGGPSYLSLVKAIVKGRERTIGVNLIVGATVFSDSITNLMQPIEQGKNYISLDEVFLLVLDDLAKGLVSYPKLSIENVRRGVQQGILALKVTNIVRVADPIVVA